MFLDEYEQREDFDKQMKTAHKDSKLSRVISNECFPRWNPLLVPGSKRKGEFWTEVEKLRVESKFPYAGSDPPGITMPRCSEGCRNAVR
jgi:hypothetical protein